MKKKGAPGGLEKTFFFWLAVAVAIHVAIFLGLVALKSFDRVQKFKPRVVSVSLLSLPGSGGSSEKVKKMVRLEESLLLKRLRRSRFLSRCLSRNRQLQKKCPFSRQKNSGCAGKERRRACQCP